MYAQIHGSMKAFIFDNLPPGTFAYHEQVPEEIRIPSVYFPHLSTNDMNNTKDSFTLLYTMTVRFFNATSSEAMQIAEEIADKIRRSRTLYLRNEDGSESSDTVYFKRVTTAPSGVGSAQLTMIFEYQQAYAN
ncbi:terminal tail protein [Bacillus phage 0105phi7-2]|uniref:Terminal tail protein n=1 Tax=Bacillus phage 0105phi7-2 TaxID=3025408 RepID=A0AAE9YBI6_9CAUD|nr:terminal tail protein [Bacillus phage 0105phi7-2]WCS66558.1 terminal tail protein [Bacillus phage 0105phi7-2]